MSLAEHESRSPATNATHPHRRTLLKGAAWTVPAVSVAFAAPAFAGSGNPTGSIAWGPVNLDLLRLGLLAGAPTGGALAAASVLPQGPRIFTATNSSSSTIAATADVAIAYKNNLLSLPILDPKGFGVWRVNGSEAAVTNRVETKVGFPLSLFGTYNTTQTLALGNLAPGSTSFDIDFGLTHNGDVGISLLVDFTATITLKSGSTVLGSSSTTLSLPIGLTLGTTQPG